MLAATYAANNQPVPSPDVLQILGSIIGYEVLIGALYRSLNLVLESLHSWWPAAQRKIVESFVRPRSPLLASLLVADVCLGDGTFVQVFQALDVIPLTAGFGRRCASERDLVAHIERNVSAQLYEPAFCAAVLRKWRSDAVSSVLRARGTLQTGMRDRTTRADQCRVRCPAARRHRQARAARLRPPFLLQDGEDGQRVLSLLRLSLRGVLLCGAPGAALGEAQEGVP